MNTLYKIETMRGHRPSDRAELVPLDLLHQVFYGVPAYAPERRAMGDYWRDRCHNENRRITAWQPYHDSSHALVYTRPIVTLHAFIERAMLDATRYGSPHRGGRAAVLFPRLQALGLCQGFTRTADGAWLHGDDCGHCECCDGTFAHDDLTTVNVRPFTSRTEEFCPECLESEAFECSSQDEYYARSQFRAVTVDGSTVCYEANQDDLYYWESDNEYHFEPEDDCNGEEDCSCDECRESRRRAQNADRIPGYHSSPKPWEGGVGKALLFGCELELKSKSTRRAIADIAASVGLYAERDGSLCDTHGLEIIGRPATLSAHQAQDGPWLSFLGQVRGKAVGWNAGDGYGIHVSINRLALSDYLAGKILVFCHNNERLCVKVAGRRASKWAVYSQGKEITEGKEAEGNRYEAMALRSRSRMEFRIFRSTVAPHGFLRAVEFTAAIVEFCRNASALGLTESAFLAWLAVPGNSGPFPNLATHLGVSLKRSPADQDEN